MTSRYQPPPRRPDHQRSAQQPRHAYEPPGPPPSRPPDHPRPSREPRDPWHPRDRHEPPDRRGGGWESQDPYGRRPDPQEPNGAQPYRGGRHSQDRPGPADSQSFRSPPPRIEDSQSFRVSPRPADSQSLRAAPRPADSQSFRTPPHPADSQSLRAPSRPQDSQSFRTSPRPQDSQSFRTPPRPEDSQSFHSARTPYDSQSFYAAPQPGRPADTSGAHRLPSRQRDASDSQELRRPHRYADRPDPHYSNGHGPRGQRPGYRTLHDSDDYRDPRHSQEFGAHEPDLDADDPYDQQSWRDHDDLPLFADRRGRNNTKGRARKRRRRRGLGMFIVLALLAGLGAGAWFGLQQMRGFGEVPDYPGTGEVEVIAQVVDGASTAEIGAELARLDVVASGKAFVLASQNNAQIRSVQPGYYRMRTKMSGASAVTLLLEPASRVGRLEIRGGMQLDDVRLPDGKVVAGILSLISTATAGQLNGAPTQVPVDQLRQAIETTDPAALGVPDWAIAGVLAAEPRRRLEGLILPGNYDVKPGAPAVEVLKALVSASALRLQAAAIADKAKGTGLPPYQVLIIASLVEREGITPDFGKVSRVIYNRLADGQRLQLDSTVNYPLDQQEVRTSDDDRLRPGPYNTYRNTGLTPTPIGAPSDKAIAAAVAPEPGAWRYFVKCQTDGTSCFAETLDQHQANVADARARGVF